MDLTNCGLRGIAKHKGGQRSKIRLLKNQHILSDKAKLLLFYVQRTIVHNTFEELFVEFDRHFLDFKSYEEVLPFCI